MNNIIIYKQQRQGYRPCPVLFESFKVQKKGGAIEILFLVFRSGAVIQGMFGRLVADWERREFSI